MSATVASGEWNLPNTRNAMLVLFRIRPPRRAHNFPLSPWHTYATIMRGPEDLTSTALKCLHTPAK